MKRLFRKGFGRVPAHMLSRMSSAGNLASRETDLRRVADRVTNASIGREWILAEITGSTALPGASNRWEYSWQEVALDEALALVNGYWDDGKSTKALNLCECVNDGAAVEGPGWDLATAPASFEIKPIAECVVQLWPHRLPDGTLRWVFFASNVLDGECPEEEA